MQHARKDDNYGFDLDEYGDLYLLRDDYHEQNISNSNLEKINISKSRIWHCAIEKASMDKAVLIENDIMWTTLTEVVISNAEMTHVCYTGCVFDKCTIKHCKLTSVFFNNCLFHEGHMAFTETKNTVFKECLFKSYKFLSIPLFKIKCVGCVFEETGRSNSPVGLFQRYFQGIGRDVPEV